MDDDFNTARTGILFDLVRSTLHAMRESAVNPWRMHGGAALLTDVLGCD
jgi:hypothetical protein